MANFLLENNGGYVINLNNCIKCDCCLNAIPVGNRLKLDHSNYNF